MHSAYATLDNPTWHALNTLQRHLGERGALSGRYLPDVAPFASVIEPSPEAFDTLHDLIPHDGQVAIQTLAPLPALRNLVASEIGTLVQMVAPGAPLASDDTDLQPLETADIPAMLQLTASARPGPFGPRTIEMGRYLGVRDNGRLIAMAGERMRLDGFTEISAVCVDEAYRGRQLAGRMINALRRDILSRGAIPFLHVLSSNVSAIALYERLGFETRQGFFLSGLRRGV